MEIDIQKLDFAKGKGLIPAIVQDAGTHKVLMLGYVNRESLQKTLAEKRITFYSRSRNFLWTKGSTSGNFLDLVEVRHDCDHDALLMKAHPRGPVCHTGADTCFKEENKQEETIQETDSQISGYEFLGKLGEIISSRHTSMPEGSYTTSLFRKGINKIAQKVGEEAVELVIEAKDDNEELFLNECADLLFHTMILLEAKGHSLKEVVDVLESRHK